MTLMDPTSKDIQEAVENPSKNGKPLSPEEVNIETRLIVVQIRGDNNLVVTPQKVGIYEIPTILKRAALEMEKRLGARD